MATLYVRKTGNDANSGLSAAAAKLTIQAAVNLATSAGDIVYVGAGSYRETVTLAASGSAGNVIQIIGDYSGAQTGDAGVVRITGSNDDITAARANCVAGVGKSYVRIQGFAIDLCAGSCIKMTGTTAGIEILKCAITCSATNAIEWSGNGHTGGLVDQCYTQVSGAGVLYENAASPADNRGHMVQRSVFAPQNATTPYGVFSWGSGGVVVANCAAIGVGFIAFRALGINSGQTMTVNNCIVVGCGFGFHSDVVGRLVENYNAVSFCGTARTNTSTGSNSNARPMLPDVRWWHALVGGGTLVSPFDFASYSQLVELNSGTGAPSTDARGSSVKGTHREWGALEYDSTLSLGGGQSSSPSVLRSPVIRGGR